MAAPLRFVAGACIVAALAAQLVFSIRALTSAYYSVLGQAIQLSHDNEAARRAFHRANAALPIESDRFRLEAAATREALGAEAAIPVYERGLRLAPRSPLLLLAAAENAVSSDRPDTAEALLARVASIMPDDWRAHHMRGQLLMKRGRIAEAEREFAAAAAFTDSGEPDVSYQWARALHALGDDARALPEAVKAIDAQKLSPDYHLLRGKILLAQRNAAAARKDFAWAVQSYGRRIARGAGAQPSLLEAKDLLAQASLAEGRFDDVQRLYGELSASYSQNQLDALSARLALLLDARVNELTAANRSAGARDELTKLLGLPGLSPVLRKHAEAALAALPAQ